MSGSAGGGPTDRPVLLATHGAVAEQEAAVAAAQTPPSTPPAEEWRASWAATLPRLAQITRQGYRAYDDCRNC